MLSRTVDHACYLRMPDHAAYGKSVEARLARIVGSLHDHNTSGVQLVDHVLGGNADRAHKELHAVLDHHFCQRR